MKSIDDWAAEKCGVTQFKGYWRGPRPVEVKGKWTIKDPRCQGAFFGYLIDDGYCVFMEKDGRGACIEISKHGIDPDTYAYLKVTCGESIKEASVEAITAIHEAETWSEEE